MTGHIIVRRKKRYLLRWVAAHVLVQSREVPYFPGDADRFELPAGEVTLLLYPDKRLSFELKPGQTIEFVIGESFFTAGFLIWHTLALLGILLLWALSLAFGESRDNFFLIAIISTYTEVRALRRHWFFMEEAAGEP